jgi:predicted amidohydrolase
MAQRALKHGVFVTGGVIEEADDGKLYNSMPIYGPDGKLVQNYRKVHLSRVMGITSESDVLTPGTLWCEGAQARVSCDWIYAISLPGAQEITFAMSGLSVGMACCFDLRFPVFLARYGPRVPSPVHCICAPSAFLDLTGKEHWELLLRRTALDGQCFVVAPDIAFDAQDATPLHGRSMVVDPFGRVISQCDAEGDGVALADITAERVEEVRAKLPLTLWEA